MRHRLLKGLLGLALAAGAFASAQNELVIVRPTDPVALDPHLETTAPGSWVYSNILEPLITLSPDMELEARLATDWEFIDETRLRFTLREGVTFHDGTPFNAEAVKFTWERAFDEDAPGPAGSWLIANSWRYGFVLSYPKDSREVTCYIYEPWHYRYVGRETAALIHESGLTLREWLWNYSQQSD